MQLFNEMYETVKSQIENTTTTTTIVWSTKQPLAALAFLRIKK
jgi:hypothetical protein